MCSDIFTLTLPDLAPSQCVPDALITFSDSDQSPAMIRLLILDWVAER